LIAPEVRQEKKNNKRHANLKEGKLPLFVDTVMVDAENPKGPKTQPGQRVQDKYTKKQSYTLATNT
jgi:hypothetical protein